MVAEGIRLEVSCMVKEFGLERVDVLRCSSTVAPIRSTQPWSNSVAMESDKSWVVEAARAFAVAALVQSLAM